MPNTLSADALSAQRRSRPRLLPTFAMLAAVAIFVAAGNWQQTRMHEKEALRAQFDAAEHMGAVSLVTLATASDWGAIRYRPVVAAGHYDARHQIFIDNKVHDGQAGYDVVTPLALADGRNVLVNRGWVMQGASRAILPDVQPPLGEVSVEGRLAVPTATYVELKSDTTKGPVWQNLDPARFAAATGIAVLPVVVEQTSVPPHPDGLTRDWPTPDFGVDKHWVYMMQWYAFAGLAVVFWLVLNFRKRPRTPR